MSTAMMTAPAPERDHASTSVALVDTIDTGDILEVGPADDPVTVMVLLASETEVILDRLDGSLPLVAPREWLANARRFDPAA